MENLENEEWRPVVGYEGIYEVSNKGRVKAMSRDIQRVHCVMKKKERILNQSLNNYGYWTVGLSSSLKRQRPYLTHRLICLAFIPNPKEKRTVNHKNGTRHDNTLSNLEWNTYSENHLHAFRELNRVANKPFLGMFGADHHSSIPIVRMSLDEKEIMFYDSMADAKRKSGFSLNGMWRCCNGRRKTYRKHKWMYLKDYKSLNKQIEDEN